jgi:DNA-binding transcriptional ArsR family regulator
MATIERLSPEQRVEPDPEHRYLSLAEAGPVLDSLTSETAQAILVELSDEPATPGVVADRVDTSLQNVSYHLSRLEAVDLVTVVGTRYSEKGREMNVYAAAVSSLVIVDPGGPE